MNNIYGKIRLTYIIRKEEQRGMYSSEIDNIMKQNNYNIDSETYIDICMNSPQINHVLYDSFSDYFNIWTSDNYYFKFRVYEKHPTK